MQSNNRKSCKDFSCIGNPERQVVVYVLSGQNNVVNINIITSQGSGFRWKWATPVLRSVTMGAIMKLLAMLHL